MAVNKYETLLIEGNSEWVTIWFNRPGSRNALSGEMVDELRKALDAIANDPQIRGVTIRGKGGVFCAGGDLKGFMKVLQGGDSSEAAIARLSREAGELFARVESLPQVVLMLVEGAAMAGGLGLLCCADVVAVTDDSQFALTETRLGIPPAQIAPYVAERLGLPRARRLILTAASFTGAEAAALGLADHVVRDAAGLEDIEAEIRKQVLRCAPGANAETKRILLATRRLSRDEMIDLASSRFARCLLSDEGREGIAAFVEKRPPTWAGPGSRTET